MHFQYQSIIKSVYYYYRIPLRHEWFLKAPSLWSIPALSKSLIHHELTSFIRELPLHHPTFIATLIGTSAAADAIQREECFLLASFVSDFPKRSEESNWQCIPHCIPRAFMPQLSALPIGNIFRMRQHIKSSPDVLKCHNMKNQVVDWQAR